jgi:hypothetical protein
MTNYYKYTFDSNHYAGFNTSGHIEGDFSSDLEVETYLMDTFGEEYIDYLRGWEEEDEDTSDDYSLEVVKLTKEEYEKKFDYFNFENGDKKGYFQI